jgi:hypothetical protein
MKRAKFTLPCGHEFIVTGTAEQLARMLLDSPSGTRLQVLADIAAPPAGIDRPTTARPFCSGDARKPVAKA